MDSKLRFIINIIFTIVILGIIFYFIDLEMLVSSMLSIDLGLFVLAMFVYLLLNFVLAYRIKGLLNYLKQEISFKQTFMAHMTGMLASDFTPARSGYFLSAIIITNNTKIKLDKALMSIVGPQMIELIWKVLVSGVMFIFLINLLAPSDNQLIITVIGFVLVVIGLSFILLLLMNEKLLNKFNFCEKIPLINFGYKIFCGMQKNGYVLLSQWKLIVSTALVAWVLKGVEWFIIAQAMGISPYGNPVQDLLFFMGLHSLITFFHFFPAPTFAGTGVAEGVAAGILLLLGVPIEIGISFAFISRLDSIIIDFIGISEILKIKDLNVLDKIKQIGN